MHRLTNAKPPKRGWPSAPPAAPPKPLPPIPPHHGDEIPANRQSQNAPLIAGSGMWESLGTIGRREFGTVRTMPGFGEREFELIDDGPVRTLDDGSFYLAFPDREPWRVTQDERGEDRTDYIDKFRRLQPWPVGTFDRLTKPRAAGKAKGSQPIDALTGLPYLRGRAPTPQAILARLAADGVTVAHGAAGELLPSSQGRWPKDSAIDVLRRPGMAAYLTGSVRCAWPHDGEAPPARTLDLLGNGLCSPIAHRDKPATGLVGKLRAAVGLA